MFKVSKRCVHLARMPKGSKRKWAINLDRNNPRFDHLLLFAVQLGTIDNFEWILIQKGLKRVRKA